MIAALSHLRISSFVTSHTLGLCERWASLTGLARPPKICDECTVKGLIPSNRLESIRLLAHIVVIRRVIISPGPHRAGKK